MSISYRQSDVLVGTAAEHSVYVQEAWGVAVIKLHSVHCAHQDRTVRMHHRKPSLSRHVTPKAAEWSQAHRGCLDGISQRDDIKGQQAYLDIPSLWYWPAQPKDAFWNIKHLATSWLVLDWDNVRIVFSLSWHLIDLLHILEFIMPSLLF